MPESSSTTAQILDGKAISLAIQNEIKQHVSEFVNKHGTKPCLAAVLVGEDPASQVYVRNKERACERVGMDSVLHRLPATTSTDQLLDLVGRLNDDPNTSGILVQLPVPKQIDGQRVLDAIDWKKDVDAFHPYNVGLLSQGRPRFLPCTPYGVIQILYRSQIKTAGKKVCVIGRSDIVGKPLASMLIQKDSPVGPDWANATVTLCHSRTPDLADVTRDADILVAAIGQPDFVTAEMIKPGATVIDVGINRVGDRLTGDVDFESSRQVAGAITPVPGGVGPLTVTMLLNNTLIAGELQREVN
ncbi:MAG: bifunctional methylenetetrahydrofolate dehydrogenase/methenyltetrahydrofolate cyclohydrolase FolD [Pirellulaceae bacterium]